MIRENQRESERIRENQRESERIRENQRESERIRDLRIRSERSRIGDQRDPREIRETLRSREDRKIRHDKR